MKQALCLLIIVALCSITAFADDYGIVDADRAGDAVVTRGEMALVSAKMQNITELFTSNSWNEKVFDDVELTNPMNGCFCFMKAMGIMVGYGDNTFRPNDPIQYQEAAKSFVTGLGYQRKAVVLGGYPEGYLQVVKELGFALDKMPTDHVTHDELRQMIDVAIGAPLMIDNTYGGTYLYPLDGKNGEPFVSLETFKLDNGKLILVNADNRIVLSDRHYQQAELIDGVLKITLNETGRQKIATYLAQNRVQESALYVYQSGIVDFNLPIMVAVDTAALEITQFEMEEATELVAILQTK